MSGTARPATCPNTRADGPPIASATKSPSTGITRNRNGPAQARSGKALRLHATGGGHSQGDASRGKGLTWLFLPRLENSTTGALNMLQLDQTESAIDIANPGIGSFELEREAPHRVQAGRATDALRLRNRQAVTESWNGREELLEGLNAPQAWIPSKYFYDSLGSPLFDAITHLPEYYPTRAEAAIFSRQIGDIARAVGTGRILIDLGAGNCEKAAGLFPALKPAHYVAVDISAAYLETALARLRHRFPDVGMTGLGLDMSEGLSLPDSVPDARRLFFYPGSSIGNFTPADAAGFLSDLPRQCQQQGGLLIGVDLIKDKAILHAAHDDALRVAAPSTLNERNNVSSVLGSDFDVRDCRHCGLFNQT